MNTHIYSNLTFVALICLVILSYSEQSFATSKVIDIRRIITTCDWDDYELNKRMLDISSKEFIKNWKARSISDNFYPIAIGDYLLFSAFMPHFGTEVSYLCYNPITNKLSVSYRNCDYISDKCVMYYATEEDTFPLEICKIGFGEPFYIDSMVVVKKAYVKQETSKEKDIIKCILSQKYFAALKELEHDDEIVQLSMIKVWDSIPKMRFVEFRDYAYQKVNHRFYTLLMLQCIEISKQMFYDVEALNLGMWWPSCSLELKDGHTSMEWVIKAYERLNTNNQYDSCLAVCYYDLARYQMDYVELLDVNTRDAIKRNLEQAYRYYAKMGNSRTIAILYKLGLEYQREKDYQTAKKYYLRSLVETKKIYDIVSYEYAAVLNKLRDVSFQLEEYDNATQYAQQYVDVCNQMESIDVNFDYQERIDSDLFLPTIYSDVQAEKEHKLFNICNQLDIKKEKLKAIEQYYARQEKWDKVYELRKELFDIENDYLIQEKLDSLANVCRMVGDTEGEEKYRLQNIDEAINQFGDSSENYALALLKIGEYYQYINDTLKALECANRAIRIEYKGHKHNYFQEVMCGCGEYALWAGQYRRAEFCYNSIVTFKEQVYGLGYTREHKATDLEPLANIYLLLGDTLKAVEIISKIIELGEQPDGAKIHNYKFLGDFGEKLGNDTVAIAFYYQGGLYEDVERLLWKHKDFEGAKPFIKQHFESIRETIGKKIITEREIGREHIWNKNNQYITITLPIYCYEAYLNSSDYSELAFDISLFTKGYLLSTSQAIQTIVLSSGNENLIKKWRELLIIQDVMSQPLENDSMMILKERARYIEQQIISTNKELFREIKSQNFTWNNVRKALSKKEIAVEFLSIPLSADSIIYYALLLRNRSKQPTLIPLFEEQQALALVHTTNESQTNLTYSYNVENGDTIGYGARLTELVWSKIIPYIREGETIYFAPSGLLHQLAIEALPYDENRTMADVFNLVRLSSTREIVLNKPQSTHTTATLYGGIQYNMSGDEILAESAQYTTTSLFASRGIDNDTLNRGNIDYLPYTKVEVEEIDQQLKQNDFQVQRYTAANANEESFKALSGTYPNILHIATHGFYWSDSTAQQKDYFSQRHLMMGSNMPQRPTIDPLNRCGLLLAGAQTAWSGHSADLPEGVQDGVLTAKEISLLDLRGCDLVVLSACETGKGEITGEGVFGLQRAFKMAGVQTIIMSLWRVNDRATKLLMTEFYRNWITLRQSKREAFRNAQNTVRSQHPEPYYWAGFIMLD